MVTTIINNMNKKCCWRNVDPIYVVVYTRLIENGAWKKLYNVIRHHDDDDKDFFKVGE